MNDRKLSLFVLASFCLALVALVLPVATNAQGRYSKRYNKRDVSNIIAKLEQSSNTFRREFDRQLDQSSLNGTNEETRLNRTVADYEQSLNRLRRDYDSSDNWWESRSNVQDVMRSARPVNSMMINLPFARRLERQWNNMRKDLNKLADTFDLPALGGSDNDNDNGGGGDVPRWALGTFYGRNPQTGGTITLNISANGSVAVTFENGTTDYASMNGDRLNNNGIIARVTRLRNGIRTTRIDNGETIDYFTRGNGNVDDDDDNNGGGNVPSWALGTFYGRNPQTGGTITLNINSNGRVLVTFENGTTDYATLNGDRLNNNGIVSRVTRINNGIRTTRIDNGERIDYRRQ